jgi:3-hydroxyisobutyrate dehydrogenase
MVGGDAEGFARARPVFESMGDLVLPRRTAGCGASARSSPRNLVGYVTLLGAAEGKALGVAAGVDPDVLYRIEEHTGP